MTNELEKQFFDTFGIEPKTMNTAIGRGFYIEHNRVEKYPQITDRILLELICILTCWHLDEREPYEITSCRLELLRDQILVDSLYIADHKKARKRVQALFKEG